MSVQALPEFEDDTDWTEKFIQEIQSRPPIYNTSLPEHSDRNLISHLWNGIFHAMVPTWDDMSSSDKIIKERELKGKWRNLKTCLCRELRKQKRGSSGPTKKRRKYVYYEQLLFLVPTMEAEDQPRVRKSSPFNNSGSESDSQTIPPMEQSQFETTNNIPQASKSTQIEAPVRSPSSTPAKKKKTPTYEESLLNILKEKRDEVIDEDKSFLLSLIPSFKKLNEMQRFEAKIEFLSTLKRLTQQNQEPPHQMPRNQCSTENYERGENVPPGSGSPTLLPVKSDTSQINALNMCNSIDHQENYEIIVKNENEINSE